MTNIGAQESSWIISYDTSAHVDAGWNADHLFLSSDSSQRSYLFVPEAWNAVIEPGEKVSFSLTGHHPKGEQWFKVAVCPNLTQDDGAVEQFFREWVALSAEDRSRFEAGLLVWNYSHFIVPPSFLFPHYPPEPEPEGSE